MSVTALAATSLPWTGNSPWQSVVRTDGTILVYRNSVRVLQTQGSVTSGQTGVGGWFQSMYSLFTSVQLGRTNGAGENRRFRSHVALARPGAALSGYLANERIPLWLLPATR